MKLSVLITIITATSMVRGAALKAHGHAGADQQLHNGTRSHAGKRAPGPTCPTSGFSPPGLPDCVCNFAGGCDLGTNAPTPTANADLTNLVGIAPQGMNTFAYGTPSLGRVCEGGVVAALYDCNARISLYAATVLDGANLHGKIGRKDCWKGTTDVNLLTDPNLLAKNGDYTGSLSHKYCYEDGAGNEFEWDDSACTTTTKFKIHKGHMIAASYGEYHGNKDATFTYTNAVPQEGSFNSGKWRSAEAGMIKTHENCLNAAGKKKKDAKTYIVVGVVPSTFLGKPRFFGSAGFGNFQGISHNNGPDDFRISIPEIMWTAGCCVHTDGTIGDKFAFWRRNRYDRNDPVKTYTSATNMFAAISTEVSNTWAGITFNAPTVFPGMPGCN